MGSLINGSVAVVVGAVVVVGVLLLGVVVVGVVVREYDCSSCCC